MYARLHELARLRPRRSAWELLNEGLEPVYDRGMAVCFDDAGAYQGLLAYRRPDVVYRSGPPNGTDLTPCCKLGPEHGRTVIRLGRAIENLLRGCPAGPLCSWLEAVVAGWGEHVEQITLDLVARCEADGVGTDHRAYLFLARRDPSGSILPAYSTPECLRLLERSALERFDRNTRTTGVCFVCGEGPREVYGSFNVLACYNFDKPGTVAGGFDVVRRPARNFPVCAECAVPLADAVSFAEAHLTSACAGLRYMVLPGAATERARGWLLDGLTKDPVRFSLDRSSDLLAEEEDLRAALVATTEQGLRDQLSFSLVFFEKDKASWRIQAEVQQVLPSRVRAVWDARRAIEADPMLAVERSAGRGKKRQREVVPFELRTMTLRDLTGDETGSVSDRLLREWLCALFAGRTVDRRAFLHQIVRSILATWRREPAFGPSATRRAWAVYRFAATTGLIDVQEGTMPEVPNSPFGRYCGEHPEFFDRPEKIAAFLVGCYCATVASVQRRERGAAPFAKKYQGRLVERRLLERLYREGREKLAQYGKLGLVARDLDPDLAEAFVACGEGWRASADETSFAFTLGLSLQYRIWSRAREAGEIDADELPPPDANEAA